MASAGSPVRDIPVHMSGKLPAHVQAALAKSTELQVEEYFRVWLSTPAGQQAVKDAIAAAQDAPTTTIDVSPGRSMLMSPTRAAPMSPGGFGRHHVGSPPLSPSHRSASASMGVGFSTSGPLSPSRAARSSPLSPRSFTVPPANVDDVYPSAEVIAQAASNSPSTVNGAPAAAGIGGALPAIGSPRQRSPASPSHASPGSGHPMLPFSPTNRSPAGGVRTSDSSPLSPTGGLGSPGIAANRRPGHVGALGAEPRTPSGMTRNGSGELPGFAVTGSGGRGGSGSSATGGAAVVGGLDFGAHSASSSSGSSGAESAGADVAAAAVGLSIDGATVPAVGAALALAAEAAAAGGASAGSGGIVLSPKLLSSAARLATAGLDGAPSVGTAGPSMPSSASMGSAQYGTASSGSSGYRGPAEASGASAAPSAVSSPASSPSMTPAPQSPVLSPSLSSPSLGASGSIGAASGSGASGAGMPPRSPRSQSPVSQLALEGAGASPQGPSFATGGAATSLFGSISTAGLPASVAAKLASSQAMAARVSGPPEAFPLSPSQQAAAAALAAQNQKSPVRTSPGRGSSLPLGSPSGAAAGVGSASPGGKEAESPGYRPGEGAQGATGSGGSLALGNTYVPPEASSADKATGAGAGSASATATTTVGASDSKSAEDSPVKVSAGTAATGAAAVGAKAVSKEKEEGKESDGALAGPSATVATAGAAAAPLGAASSAVANVSTAASAAAPAVGRGAKSIPTFYRPGVGPLGTGAAIKRARQAAENVGKPTTPSLSMGTGLAPESKASLAGPEDLEDLLEGFSKLAVSHAKLRNAGSTGSVAPSTTTAAGAAGASATGTTTPTAAVAPTPAAAGKASTASTAASLAAVPTHGNTDRHFSSRPVLPGESLETRLHIILEAFRKHNAGGPVPAHPFARYNERVRKRRAASKSAAGASGKSAGSSSSRPGSANNTGRPSLSASVIGGGRRTSIGSFSSTGKGGSATAANGRRLSGASSVAGSEDGDDNSDHENENGPGGSGPSGPRPVQVSVQCCGVRLGWEDAHTAVSVDQFASLTKPLIGHPSFFAAPLFRRIRHTFGGPKSQGGRPVAPADWSAEASKLEAELTALEAKEAKDGTGPGAAGAKDAKGGRASVGGTAGRGRAGSDASDGKGTPKAGADGNTAGAATVTIGGQERVLTCSPVPNAIPSSDAERSKETSDHDNAGLVTLPQFLAYWRAEVERYDPAERFVRLLAARWRPWRLEPQDFLPVLEELLAYHPGLAFLEHTPEFQDKYARTVVARIMYSADPTGRNALDVAAVRAAVPPVLPAFALVDVENDINAVPAYFSYEHFYVLYCKFWELDADHDFWLSRSDLSRMTHLTPTLLDRVYAQAGRPFVAGGHSVPGANGRMGYEDFCAFFLACEDKTHASALRYWFNIADVDGDGVLTASDMRHFWPDQSKRMRDHGLEVVKFEDVLCQFHDLLQPAVEGRITFGDFTHPARIKLTGCLFNGLWDLDKFQRFEAREGAMVKQGENFAVTQWDRYAAAEYQRLAAEEEDTSAAGAAGNLGW